MTNDALADIVLFSTADWESQYLTNKQHMAAHLAARGHRVLYVESVGIRRPSFNKADFNRLWERLKNGVGPIRSAGRNLWVYSPLAIPLGRRSKAINTFNQWILRTGIRGWLSRLKGQSPLIWTYHPFMLEAAEAINASTLIYHCVDDVSAVPNINRAAFEAAEIRLLERADLIFATSHLLQTRCSAVAGMRSHYFGNVADIAWFGTARAKGAPPAELGIIPEPRLGYVGALSDYKIDFEMLEAVIAAHREWHFVFIGDEREGQRSDAIARMRQQPNAHFIGWKPYEELPRYLMGLSVGLLPQSINDYTRAMFPMKFFEYLAAGLPVVATPLPALRDFATLFGVGEDAKAFAGAINAALSGNGAQVPELDDPAFQANSWNARLEKMWVLVEACAREKRGYSTSSERHTVKST